MSDLPTQDDVLAYWIGDTNRTAEHLQDKHKLWFGKSEHVDADIRAKFLDLLEHMSAVPFADDWAALGPRGRLGAIIVLDQFSRNLFRDSARAFTQDPLALRLCKDGIALNEDKVLSETERVFFYLPLEHSERMQDQEVSIRKFTELAEEARPEFRDFARNTLDYAHQHRKVIEQFGRFPHRNRVLGRESTPEESDWLARGGGF